jgi:hypothetical protein
LARNHRTLNGSLILVIILSFVLISSSVLGKGFTLMPNIPLVKITSSNTGDTVPAGNLTISGTSSDNSTTDCQVFVDWNDLKPTQKAIPTGLKGANDYSSWKFTYTSSYHLITNGSNELTSKLSCIDKDGFLSKWNSINVTGISDQPENITEAITNFQQQNLTDSYQRTLFSSLNMYVPTYSEAKTIIKEKKTHSTVDDESLKKFLSVYLKVLSQREKNKLTAEQQKVLQVLPKFVSQSPTPEQKLQLDLMLPYLVKSFLDLSKGPSGSPDSTLVQLAKSALGSKFNLYAGAFNLGIKLGSLTQSRQLQGSDVLFAIASIYLSTQTGGILGAVVGADMIFDVLKGVTSFVSNFVSKQGAKPSIQGIAYGIPPSVCDSNGNLSQCNSNLIPIPMADCDLGNQSKCIDLDPMRNIGYCDDSQFNCIIQGNYTPPLPGPDGYYYYPSDQPLPVICHDLLRLDKPSPPPCNNDYIGNITESIGAIPEDNITESIGAIPEDNITESIGAIPEDNITESIGTIPEDNITESIGTIPELEPDGNVTKDVINNDIPEIVGPDEVSSLANNLTEDVDSAEVVIPTEETPSGITPSTEEPPSGITPSTEEPPSGITPSTEEPPSGITPPAEEPPSGITPPAEEPPSGITPPAEEPLTDQEVSEETPSQQEDDGNYCPKNDEGCDETPDGDEPSWCSHLQGGCRNFIVCDENECKYDKSLLREDTSTEEGATEDTSTEEGATEDTSTEEGATEDTSTEEGATEDTSTQADNTN